MKPVVPALGCVTLCLATLAYAQDIVDNVVVISGVPYRIVSINASLLINPEVPFGPRKPEHTLGREEILSRCDEFVALALKSRGLPDSGVATLVRDRVDPGRDNGIQVIYAQRHRGYKILGAGGRLMVDAYGRVRFAGLTCETEKLRTFQPMDSVALEKRAAPAVPHPRVGPPVSLELMIDPLHEAPAQLRAFFLYQVRVKDMVQPWRVVLNAETGEVVYSFSLYLNAESPSAGGP